MANYTVTGSHYFGDNSFGVDYSALAYGDTITNNAYTVTVDPSIQPPTNIEVGWTPIFTAGFSELVIRNTLPTALKIYGFYKGSFRFENSSALRVVGQKFAIKANGGADWVSDGTASQTIATGDGYGWLGTGFVAAEEPAVLFFDNVTEDSRWGALIPYMNLAYLELSDIGGRGGARGNGLSTLGNWFKFDNTTGVITLGDGGLAVNGKGGNIPPVGARCYYYNIGFGTKNASGIFYGTSAITDCCGFDLAPAGELNVENCYFFGWNLTINQYKTALFTDVGYCQSVVGVNWLGAYFKRYYQSIDRYLVTHSFAFRTYGTGITVEYSIIVSDNKEALYQNNNDNIFKNSEFWTLKRGKSIYQSSGLGGCTYNDCKFIGSDVGPERASIKNLHHSDSPHGLANAIPFPVSSIVVTESTVDGIFSIDDGCGSERTDSSAAVIVYPKSLGNSNYDTKCTNFANLSNSKVYRCHSKSPIVRSFFTNDGSPLTEIINCTSDNFVGGIAGDRPSYNMIIKGLDVAEASIVAISDLCNNSIFFEFRTALTDGWNGIWFSEQTSDKNYYAIIGTGVKFNGTGRMYIFDSTSSITYTWPHDTIGATALRNIAPVLGGSGTGNFIIEYSFNGGTFKALTAANLSSETITSAKHKMSIRISHATGSTSDYLNIIRWATTVDYDNYKYPIDTYSLTVGPVDPSTEIRIMEHGTQNELTGIENVGSTGYFTYEYSYSGTPFFVDINILHATTYENRFIKNVELAGENKSILIEQTPDRWYKNP